MWSFIYFLPACARESANEKPRCFPPMPQRAAHTKETLKGGGEPETSSVTATLIPTLEDLQLKGWRDRGERVVPMTPKALQATLKGLALAAPVNYSHRM